MKFTKIELFSVAAVLGLSVLFFSQARVFNQKISTPFATPAQNNFENIVLPPGGIEIPVRWNDLGSKLVDVGVIDKNKFEAIYSQRGGLIEEEKQILYGKNNGNIKITPENAGFWLNMLWAFGLSNKNKILENGPMTDLKYGGDASRFASTGGWTLAKGDPSTGSRQGAMEHYSKHSFIILTSEQQKLAEEVSKNIYRPCCGNPTYFPDCNHGMAMLGLLELMASQGISEKEMYKIALQINSYWFPDTYLTIEKYLKEKKNTDWANADPKEILGYNYSSASGYQNILSEVAPPVNNRGQGCGI
ncbi:MAG: hypothetical protein HYW79_01515 [Parcubacteria group bacterium]|nr:hypothetical protein [Parcubacteria group bacterium]